MILPGTLVCISNYSSLWNHCEFLEQKVQLFTYSEVLGERRKDCSPISYLHQNLAIVVRSCVNDNAVMLWLLGVNKFHWTWNYRTTIWRI